MAVPEPNPPVTFVRAHRLWSRLHAMAKIGGKSNGGVDRPALSNADIEARAQLVAWGSKIGLSPSVDPAGNLFLRLEGRDATLAPVIAGSHLDSQPTGGKFDGAYGVIAALECTEALVAHGERPLRSIDVVSWTNEEGSRFAPGMMGSAAFTLARPLSAILDVTDADGISVRQALSAVRKAEAHLSCQPLGRPAFAYVEAHIEQGSLLQSNKKSIGIVKGMQGKRTFRVRVIGEQGHAGTVPVSARKDALLAAVASITALRELLSEAIDVVKFTVGYFTVQPNAPSVIPSEVDFSIDLRCPDSNMLMVLGNQVERVCASAAGSCKVIVRELSSDTSLQFPAFVQSLIRKKADELSIESMSILSNAGHDARYLHRHCPTGMIFIPCLDGISHHESESITENDALLGAMVLTGVVAELANQPTMPAWPTSD